jgi:acetyl esterase/lipase
VVSDPLPTSSGGTRHRHQHGEQPRERLDLFLAGNPAAPTLAYIHGGYWQMTQQTKELMSGQVQLSSDGNCSERMDVAH